MFKPIAGISEAIFELFLERIESIFPIDLKTERPTGQIYNRKNIIQILLHHLSAQFFHFFRVKIILVKK